MSENEKTFLDLEPDPYRSGDWSRSYTAYVKGDPDRIMLLEKQITITMNDRGLNRTEVVTRAFYQGLGQLVNDSENQDDAELEKLQIRCEIMNRANERRVTKEKLHLIYIELGLEEAQRYAEAAGIEVDFNSYMSDFIIPMESWSVVALRWLKETLADGESYSVESIQSKAMSQAILPGEDNDDFQRSWTNLKSLASENNMSGGRRGFWQLPKA